MNKSDILGCSCDGENDKGEVIKWYWKLFRLLGRKKYVPRTSLEDRRYAFKSLAWILFSTLTMQRLMQWASSTVLCEALHQIRGVGGTACSTETSETSCPLIAYSPAERTDCKPLTQPKTGKVRDAKCWVPASISGKTIVMIPLSRSFSQVPVRWDLLRVTIFAEVMPIPSSPSTHPLLPPILSFHPSSPPALASPRV